MTDVREDVRLSAARVEELKRALEAAIADRDAKIVAAHTYGVRTEDIIRDARFTERTGRNNLYRILRRVREAHAQT